ncbi:AraC family transcriptional regulator [Sphingobacterium corticibacter]|uniref:AraC family transcriptional regulator n=1 Tax=Sphingobacterium corticibacter TaxID=2171749 RepID=A0A2T8HN63_9SPHI|nr:helix-turn-helix transcriptional regulator [Sphingobacterium corticibacter]PVH26877.1 AraC family transcriptional regulator [Sphingobacterium corticibacter]
MEYKIKKYTMPQEFELIGIEQLYNDNSDKLTTLHRIGFYHILWFQKGNPTHLVDFNPVKIKPNTILFLNKDTVQRFDKKGGFDGKAILFTDSFFCKTETDTKYLRSSILFNNLFSVAQIQISETASLFADLFKLMDEELKNQSDSSQPYILKNLLHNFLLLSERERQKQDVTEIKKGPDFDYVMLFKDVLETNFRKLKQVSSYAKMISVTEKRLNQATQKTLDKSPKQMIDERVMLEAKRLLAHTNESIKEIGFDLGFDEPTNFIKYFRKHNSSTPVEFRKQFASA